MIRRQKSTNSLGMLALMCNVKSSSPPRLYHFQYFRFGYDTTLPSVSKQARYPLFQLGSGKVACSVEHQHSPTVKSTCSKTAIAQSGHLSGLSAAHTDRSSNSESSRVVLLASPISLPTSFAPMDITSAPTGRGSTDTNTEWPYSLFDTSFIHSNTPKEHPILHSPSNRRLSPLPKSDVRQDVLELQASHSSLLLQLSNLTDEVSRMKQRSLETERIVRGPYNANERSLSRAIMFSNIASQRVLKKIHSELSREYPSLFAANSVRQVVLKSRPVDCTLSDFRLLATHVASQVNIHSSISPPMYETIFCSTNSIPSIELRFETFWDIAEALRLADDTRIKGAYQERKQSTGQLRGVQILGVEALKYGDPDDALVTTRRENTDNVTLLERKLLLGRSELASSDKRMGAVHVLHQESCQWTEKRWEVGFQYREDDRDSLKSFRIPETSKLCAFSMKWERCLDSPFPRDSCPELIPGTLKSYFPAVVLRTRTLTDGLQQIFKVQPDGSSLQQKLFSKG